MSALEAVDVTEAGETETDLMAAFFNARTKKELNVKVIQGDDGEYRAIVTPSYFSVGKASMCEMTFNVDPASPAGTTFQDPPVVFFGERAPALTMPLQTATQAKVLWSNVDPAVQGRSFDYRVRLRVGDKAVVEDPTVQNDPPPPTGP